MPEHKEADHSSAEYLYHTLRQVRKERDAALRIIAGLRALVEAKDQALTRIEDMTTDYVATDKAAGHVAREAQAALALTEEDMRHGD